MITEGQYKHCLLPQIMYSTTMPEIGDSESQKAQFLMLLSVSI